MTEKVVHGGVAGGDWLGEGSVTIATERIHVYAE